MINYLIMEKTKVLDSICCEQDYKVPINSLDPHYEFIKDTLQNFEASVSN